MKTSIQTGADIVNVGTRIRIKKTECRTTPSRAFPDGIDRQAAEMQDTEGIVQHIDDLGQLHGTWGGLAVIPKMDEFEILE